MIRFEFGKHERRTRFGRLLRQSLPLASVYFLAVSRFASNASCPRFPPMRTGRPQVGRTPESSLCFLS